MKRIREIKEPLIALICLISLIIGIVLLSKDKVSFAEGQGDVNDYEYFKSASARELLGKNLLVVGSREGMTYRVCRDKGQYGCLSHKTNNNGDMNNDDNKVNSVYDVVFKKDEDDVRKLSIQSVGRGMGSKIAYGGRDKEGKLAINLALQMSKDHNMQGVYDALRKAVAAGVVVHDPAIITSQEDIVAGRRSLFSR